MTRTLLAAWVLWIGCATPAPADSERPGNPRGYETDILTETFGLDQAALDAPIDKVIQGCSHRDCIPSIDEPSFVRADSVHFLDADDLLLVLDHDGLTRAYPARILDLHEIVNDRFGDDPVLISYCPLCGSGLAFLRELDGRAVEFGVSGLLHNNDLIMYDRASESLWQQITGRSIGGPRRGQVLQSLPLTMTSWGEWQPHHPSVEVLEPPGGPEAYAQRRYADYEDSDRLLFPVTAESARLAPKRVIYGVELPDQAVAVDAEWLAEKKQWSHGTAAGELSLEVAADGGVHGSLGSEPIAVHRMFWFAWYSFHPATSLVDGSNTQ
jgi:hypothetical protein